MRSQTSPNCLIFAYDAHDIQEMCHCAFTEGFISKYHPIWNGLSWSSQKFWKSLEIIGPKSGLSDIHVPMEAPVNFLNLNHVKNQRWLKVITSKKSNTSKHNFSLLSFALYAPD